MTYLLTFLIAIAGIAARLKTAISGDATAFTPPMLYVR